MRIIEPSVIKTNVLTIEMAVALITRDISCLESAPFEFRPPGSSGDRMISSRRIAVKDMPSGGCVRRSTKIGAEEEMLPRPSATPMTAPPIVAISVLVTNFKTNTNDFLVNIVAEPSSRLRKYVMTERTKIDVIANMPASHGFISADVSGDEDTGDTKPKTIEIPAPNR